MDIQFSNQDEEREMHVCESRREGEWIIFTCPHCEEYENRINLQTKERKCRKAKDPFIFHRGSFLPPSLEIEGSTPN
ncbi:MAG: hypothetical protein H6563_05920 [Lewinellaceae bacterium]|nr:hypothetical protein [Lewinellaceae bacterium]